MALPMKRMAYAYILGPTTADQVRPADTNLTIKVENDFTDHGGEVKFGGDKVIRDGMEGGRRVAHLREPMYCRWRKGISCSRFLRDIPGRRRP